jgi:cytochrome c biogenesis protein CcdA
LSYTAGLIAAILVLGHLLHSIPRFNILMSLWTGHIYLSLGLICLCAGIILAGLTPLHEQGVSEFFSRHKPLPVILALFLGVVSALIETPICPSCGSTISIIVDATHGRGNGLTGIVILSLYALGECIPFLLPGIVMIVGKNMLYDKKSLNAQVALLAISLLLVLSALLFFWTC